MKNIEIPELSDLSDTGSNDESHLEDSDDEDVGEPGKKRRFTQDPDYTKHKDYNDLINEIKRNAIKTIALQLKNNSALLRKAILLFLEYLAQTDMDINPLIASWVCLNE